MLKRKNLAGVYIQLDTEKSIPYNFECACAMYGAMASKIDCDFVAFKEIQQGECDSFIPSRLFVGSVEFMQEVFSRVGLKNIKVPSNSNREYELSTLGEAKKRAKKGEKLFIKPTSIKAFTGLVLDQSFHGEIEGVSEDLQVLIYEPFKHNIESEWRIYVHNHKIIDSKNYSGNFELMPDYRYVQEQIFNNRKNFPDAYTIDAGVLSNEETVIVEYNDMWAIGNYGLPNNLYYRLLKDRYFQIMRDRK